MARNRKRAKERPVRPQPGVSAVPEDDEELAPSPIAHAMPDVELAEAQLALGRGEPQDELLEEEPVEEELEEAGQPPRNGTGRAVATAGHGPGGGHGAVAARKEPLPQRLIAFLQGSWRELQRVQWPDRRQVMQATGVVIGFVIVAGVFLGVTDWAAGKIVTFILK